MRLVPASPYADLVFHVLAHVRGTAHLAPSLYDREYVTFAFRALGPAAERSLHEDAELLGRALPTHDALARAQLLAWLFHTKERARAASTRDLAALGAGDVDAPELLPMLAGDAGVELLRCAVDLEAEAHEKLPPSESDEGEVRAALARVMRAAPVLEDCEIACVRALRLRGRVRGKAIWVGAPSPLLGLPAEHVAWQAAHEATVGEVSDEAPKLSHDDRESVAVVLLYERAEREGLREGHARWLAHLGQNAPPTTRTSLPAPLRDMLGRRLARTGG